jgi:hypothetical protein
MEEQEQPQQADQSELPEALRTPPDNTSSTSFWDKVGAEFDFGYDSGRYGSGSPEEKAAWDRKESANKLLSPDHSTAAELLGGPAGLVGGGISSIYHYFAD